jgi:methylthioribose-1-phosphate isomerase
MSHTIWWEDDHPALIDQTLLPFEERILHCHATSQMVEAIKSLRVRGAPAIGVAAAYGVAHAAALASTGHPDEFSDQVHAACTALAGTRPTAVNLFWAIDRMRRVLTPASGEDPRIIASLLLVEAHAIAEEDARACRAMGEIGAPLIKDGMGVLTHCNAGALATAGIGTATAPIIFLREFTDW